MKKKILLGVLVSLLLVGVLGVTFAIFSYTRTSPNEQLITGDIYMHYKESNTLTLENALPSNTYDPEKYFEFTIDGKNTNTKYDIIYDVNLIRGDVPDGKIEQNRLQDKFIKFRLTEFIEGVETEIFTNKSLNDLSSAKRVHVDIIPKNTMNEVIHRYRLYMWISNDVVIGNEGNSGIDYNLTEWNNLFASIKVTSTGDFEEKKVPVQIGDKLSKAILANVTSDNSDVDSDNVIYISGCSDEITGDSDCTNANTIDFNFVWYSGKLWRVVSIYPDGDMKLVTENPITAIYWGSDTTYNGSWVYQWLNEDFNDTLANKNTVLAAGKQWNATMTDETTKPAETTMVGGNVGLLNAYEYTESYKKANNNYDKGYLNIKQSWWLITPNSSSCVRDVYSSGKLGGYSTPMNGNNSVRPSINLSSFVTFAGGEGTRNNPYKIGEDISAPATNALLNTRLSGEYVSFKGEDFRIVGVENRTTKIVKADYVMSGSSALKKIFGSSKSSVIYGKGTSNNTWDYYLNNTWLAKSDKALLDKGTYYLGEYGNTGISYKATICDRTIEGNLNKRINGTDATNTCIRIQNTESITTNTYTGYVGLLRVGEMFSSQFNGTYNSYNVTWLITPLSSSIMRAVNNLGPLYYSSPSSGSYAVRPTVNLKSNIIITGGDGTEQHPFQIALPN